MNIKVLLGKRIKELRTAKKITQAQLAEAIGVEPRSISRIESGFHFPKDEHIQNISNILGVEIEDLFNFSHIDSENIKEKIEALINSATQKELVLIYKIIKNILK